MANSEIFLDASILDNKEYTDVERLDVAMNRIKFKFPQGFTQLPLLEECRALDNLNDFDLMFDILMQMLTEKPVEIYLRDLHGEEHLIANFVVTDRYMDLRGIDIINQYPCIITWLLQFVGEHLLKKFPRLSLASQK